MSWVAVGLLGGLVGLDTTSFPQLMISRPLVAGALAGALLGHPFEGILIGAILEAFDLGVLPIGASRYPESGPAAVAAAAAYVMAGPELGVGALLIAAVFGLVWERVGGASIVLSRVAVARLLPQQRVTPRRVVGAQLAGLAIDFLRGAAVSVFGAAVGLVLVATLAPYWNLSRSLSLGGLALAATVVLAGALSVFGGWGEKRTIFMLGLLCGSIALLFLQA